MILKLWSNPNRIDGKKMERVMRNIFGTEDGEEFLNFLLHRLSFFDICNTEELKLAAWGGVRNGEWGVREV